MFLSWSFEICRAIYNADWNRLALTLGTDLSMFCQVRSGAEEGLAWGIDFDSDFVEADNA